MEPIRDTQEFYFNVRTHQVEEGAQSNWKELLGPYRTRAEAESALARVQANNEAFDEDEEREDRWDVGPLDDAR